MTTTEVSVTTTETTETTGMGECQNESGFSGCESREDENTCNQAGCNWGEIELSPSGGTCEETDDCSPNSNDCESQGCGPCTEVVPVPGLGSSTTDDLSYSPPPTYRCTAPAETGGSGEPCTNQFGISGCESRADENTCNQPTCWWSN
jgi:hypothetical protein